MSLEHELAQLEKAQLVRQLADEEQAYYFNHALVQETAYQSLLIRVRRELNRRVAEIYERLYAEQLDTHASLLARYYEEAGDIEKAVAYLRRVGERAKGVGALVEALESFKHALALTPQVNLTARADLSIQIGALEVQRGQYQAAAEWLGAGLALAHAGDDHQVSAQALCELSAVAVNQGDYEQARQSAQDALARARDGDDLAIAARALRMLGVVASYHGDNEAAARYCEESLALYRGLGDRRGINSCLNSLGVIALNREDHDAAKRYFDEALEMSRETGDRLAIGTRLMNLGNVAGARHDFAEANAYFGQALAIAREIGSKEDIATNIFNLGDIAALQGEDRIANRYFRDALALALEIGALPLALTALVGIAALKAKTGEAELSAEILGFALNHAASNAELRAYAEPALESLRTTLLDGTLEAALVRWKNLSLDEVVKGTLAESEGNI
jgi:tetratricopeptide (TPR) repeat protein